MPGSSHTEPTMPTMPQSAVPGGGVMLGEDGVLNQRGGRQGTLEPDRRHAMTARLVPLRHSGPLTGAKRGRQVGGWVLGVQQGPAGGPQGAASHEGHGVAQAAHVARPVCVAAPGRGHGGVGQPLRVAGLSRSLVDGRRIHQRCPVIHALPPAAHAAAHPCACGGRPCSSQSWGRSSRHRSC